MEPIVAGVVEFLTRTAGITIGMLSAFGSVQPSRYLFIRLAFNVGLLTAFGVWALAHLREKWHAQWSGFWFNAGSRVRDFGERFARGPLAQGMLFATVSISAAFCDAMFTPLFSGVEQQNATLPVTVAQQGTPPGLDAAAVTAATAATAASTSGVLDAAWGWLIYFGGGLETLLCLIAFACALMAWWGCRIGLILPNSQRWGRAGTHLLYLAAVACLFTYDSHRLTSAGHTVDFVSFLVLLLRNPVPTLLLGFLAVWPCVRFAKVVERTYPHNLDKRIGLMFLGNAVIMVQVTRVAEHFTDALFRQAATAQPLSALIVNALRVSILATSVVLAWHFWDLVHVVYDSSAVFRINGAPSLGIAQRDGAGIGGPGGVGPSRTGGTRADGAGTPRGGGPGRQRRPSGVGGSSVPATAPAEQPGSTPVFPPIWRTLRIPRPPPIFDKMQRALRDFRRLVLGDQERPLTLLASMLGLARFSLGNLRHLRPQMAAVREAALRGGAPTKFQIECSPVLDNPCQRDLVITNVDLVVREWSRRSVLAAVPLPQVLWNCTTLARLHIEELRIPANSPFQPRPITIDVTIHTPVIGRVIGHVLALVPGAVALRDRVLGMWQTDAEGGSQGQNGTQRMVAALLGRVLGSASEHGPATRLGVHAGVEIDVALSMRRRFSSLTIPMLRYRGGEWSGDVLNGWDHSGILHWVVDHMETYRRSLMQRAMHLQAVRHGLRTQLDAAFEALVAIETRDAREHLDADPEERELLRYMLALDCLSSIHDRVWDIYRREGRHAARRRRSRSRRASSASHGKGGKAEEESPKSAPGSVAESDPTSGEASPTPPEEGWSEWMRRLPTDHRLSLLVLWEMGYRGLDRLMLRAVQHVPLADDDDDVPDASPPMFRSESEVDAAAAAEGIALAAGAGAGTGAGAGVGEPTGPGVGAAVGAGGFVVPPPDVGADGSWMGRSGRWSARQAAYVAMRLGVAGATVYMLRDLDVTAAEDVADDDASSDADSVGAADAEASAAAAADVGGATPASTPASIPAAPAGVK